MSHFLRASTTKHRHQQRVHYQLRGHSRLHRPSNHAKRIKVEDDRYWFIDGLIEAGYVLHLANTSAIKEYDDLKHRGDESDARLLAQLLRRGLLPEG